MAGTQQCVCSTRLPSGTIEVASHRHVMSDLRVMQADLNFVELLLVLNDLQAKVLRQLQHDFVLHQLFNCSFHLSVDLACDCECAHEYVATVGQTQAYSFH